MDLGAYAQIEILDAIAKANGIDIPRLRGYRLMKNEEPLLQHEINKIKKKSEVRVAEDLCTAEPFWNPNTSSHMFSEWTDRLCDYYLVKNFYGDYVDIRWDRIHGWKRKVLKFEIKKEKRKIQQQYDMWNKYACREDVLYIHSRMGGNNWKYWDPEKRTELMNQPWFLDRVDDSFDSTYCDFYAQISTEMSTCENEKEMEERNGFIETE